MAADDFLNTPPDQGFPADLDSSSMSGNRPASGARRATPGEVLSQGFQGAQNAGDFLGLDTEFTAMDPNQAYAAAAGSPLDLVPPPGTYADNDAGLPAPAAPAPMPSSDPVQEFAQAPSAFEFGGDLGSEEGEPAQEAQPGSSKKPLFVGALLVAALTTGGVYFGPTLYSRYFGTPTKVVDETKPPGWQEKPTRPKPDAAKPEDASKPVTEVASQTGPSAAAANPLPKEPALPQEPVTTALTKPGAAAGAKGESDTPGESVEASVLPGVPPTLPSVAVRPAPTTFPDLNGAEYLWASADQLELIWRGSEVPLEALRAPAKTLMPRVGSVRVFTTSGDVFEGRLYAVGQNRVWLDAQPGRIGLDAERVERIEVLPPAPEGVQTSGEIELAGGKRVRVRVPGGMLYGRVLKAEGEDVMLALDDGGRVRVRADDLQDLGTGRAVVVRH